MLICIYSAIAITAVTITATKTTRQNKNNNTKRNAIANCCCSFSVTADTTMYTVLLLLLLSLLHAYQFRQRSTHQRIQEYCSAHKLLLQLALQWLCGSGSGRLQWYLRANKYLNTSVTEINWKIRCIAVGANVFYTPFVMRSQKRCSI